MSSTNENDAISCIDLIFERLNFFAFYDDAIEFPGMLEESHVIGRLLIEEKFLNLPKEKAIETGFRILEKIEKIKRMGESQFYHCVVSNEKGEIITDKNSDEYRMIYGSFYREVIEEINRFGEAVSIILDKIQFDGIHSDDKDSRKNKGAEYEYLNELSSNAPTLLGKGKLVPKYLSLFVSYLKEMNIILDVDDKPLSVHLHYMTGHSQQNIRAYLSGKQVDILKNDGYEKVVKGSCKNLTFLKTVVDNLQERIKKDIENRS